MNDKDGNVLIKAIEEYINTELRAGNTMTKYGGGAFAQDMGAKINQIIISDSNKEKLWAEHGEDWLKEKEEIEKEKIEKEKNRIKNKKLNNVIDSNKTIKESFKS